MRVAVTGATGFLGRYIVNHLASEGHRCRCWYRPESDRGGFDAEEEEIEWLAGSLANEGSMSALVDGTDAVVHAALDRPGLGFRGAEGDVTTFVEANVLGTIRLIEAARKADVPRFIFISTCAVHEKILTDRKLDETHPTWPKSHYGAHKAAIETFIHSYGWGEGYDICSLRPTGIYGPARPIKRSKWYDVVHAVKAGETISSAHGGKEVYAGDVAKAVAILLTAEGIAGEAFNCYDMYIAVQDVAAIAQEMTGSASTIEYLNKGPKNQINTKKLRELGLRFSGDAALERTVRELLKA